VANIFEGKKAVREAGGRKIKVKVTLTDPKSQREVEV
jgi:hypothetical protein